MRPSHLTLAVSSSFDYDSQCPLTSIVPAFGARLNDFPIFWNCSHCFSFPDVAAEPSAAVQRAGEKQSAWVAVLPERAVESAVVSVAERSDERAAYAVRVVIAQQAPDDETSEPAFALWAADDETSEPAFALWAAVDETSEPAFALWAPADELSELAFALPALDGETSEPAFERQLLDSETCEYARCCHRDGQTESVIVQSDSSDALLSDSHRCCV